MANHERRDIVVIGASAGGIRALRTLLAGLPEDLDAAVFVVMHMAAEAPGILPSILNAAGPLPVIGARDGMPIRRRTVVVAPPDHHLILDQRGTRLSHGPRENRHRPSIDVLFRSAAVAFGSRVIGIVLSGMLDDGTAGLWAIKRRGGQAVVQDPADAEYADMPRNAMRINDIDACVTAAQIARKLPEWIQQRVEAVTTAPPRMASEVQMASKEPVEMEEMDSIGRRVPITCPECGGAMWEVDDSGLARFRCHVGHAYSLLSLGEDQSTRVESAIWAALRSLEENVRIAERMAQSALARGEGDWAAYHQDRSMASSRHAQVLRDVLEQAATLPAMEPAHVRTG